MPIRENLLRKRRSTLEVLAKFYAGSREYDRMRAELDHALKILKGLLERDLKRLRRPDRKKYHPKPIRIECAEGVLWMVSRSINENPKQHAPYDYVVEIKCIKESFIPHQDRQRTIHSPLYPGGTISTTTIAYNSFAEFYRKLLLKKRRIAAYIAELESLAPPEVSTS